MKYGSVCSGIEAASVAWESLGWEAQWFSEIEHFPSAVLAHRFPTVPNLGDMTKIHETETFNGNSIDLLVGGTPCQSFSVAGLRKGLADPRGNLMLTFLSLAERKKPRWIVWENVPGVLSSNGGKDFGTFLGALGELGYGVAYRVLDAQYFGVAQRRRRVFVVGYLGDWRVAAAVLFESSCLSGDTKESRKKRKEVTGDASGGIGESGIPRLAGSLDTECGGGKLTHQSVNNGHLIPIVAKCLTAKSGPRHDPETENIIPTWWNGEQTAGTLTKQNANGAQRMPDKDNLGAVLEPIKWVSPDGNETIGTLRARDYKGIGNDDLTQGRGLAVAHPFRKVRRAQSSEDFETWEEDEKTNTLNTFDTGDVRSTNVVAQPIAAGFIPKNGAKARGIGYAEEQTPTLDTGCSNFGIVQPIAVDCYNQTINGRTSQTIGSSASDVNHYGAVLTPTIIDRAAFNQGENAQYEPRIERGQTMSSLVAKGPHGVATPNISPTITVLGGQHPNAAIGENTCPTITNASGAGGGHIPLVPQQPTMAIRRLTPTETERLQGFPDHWTKIPYRNKPADQCPDGPRYKACDNSMAVPVMRWIGQRIEYVESLMKEIS